MTVWSKGNGVPESRYGATVLVRMKRHHDYESAMRQERTLERLEQIVRDVVKSYRRGRC